MKKACSSQPDTVIILPQARFEAMPDIGRAFRALRSQIDYVISLIDQKTAIAALAGPQDFVDKNRARYKACRDALYNGLSRVSRKVPLSKAATVFMASDIYGQDERAV